MRIMVFGEDQRRAARAIADYSAAPDHWCRPSPEPFAADDPRIPGNNPAHVLLVQFGIRCVYSVSVFDNRPWRHLSISVSDRGFPHPAMVVELAAAFGFTGGSPASPGPDWLGWAQEAERTASVMQPLPVEAP